MNPGKAKAAFTTAAVCLPFVCMLCFLWWSDGDEYERAARRATTKEQDSLALLCELASAETGYLFFSAESVSRNDRQFARVNEVWIEHSTHRRASMDELLLATGLSSDSFRQYDQILRATGASKIQVSPAEDGPWIELELYSTPWFYGHAKALVFVGSAERSLRSDQSHFKPMPMPGWYYVHTDF